MRYIGLSLLLVSTLSFGEVKTNDKWTGTDKDHHALIGAVVGSSVTMVTNDWLIGAGTGCVVGSLKEYYDYKHPNKHTSSLQDFAVTCLSSGIAAKLTDKMYLTPRSLVFKMEF